MPLRKIEHVDAGDSVRITRTFAKALGAVGGVNPQTMSVYRVQEGVREETLTPALTYAVDDSTVTAVVDAEFPIDSPSGTQFVVFVLTAPLVATEIVEFAVHALPALPA